jgi:steroid 5-alpha reductase family enzyme
MDLMWILAAFGIEGLALAGAISVAVTRRMRVAFVTGFNSMAWVTALFIWFEGNGPRVGLVAAMVGLYLLRMNWTLLLWSRETAISKLERETPKLQQVLLPFVIANAFGWGYCLPLYFAVRDPAPLSLHDGIGIAIYILGTVFHFGADYQKRRFKLRADTRGRLLDTGFWAISRHPNYFGDFLIYVSFAVIGGSAWGWIAPLLNLLQYAFDAIPKNEKWAAARYGAAWEGYRSRTKAFVPYLV